LSACIRSETTVVTRMHRTRRVYRLVDHLGQPPGKLVSTPPLHRASRSWRELHVADREAESGTSAVWDLPALPLASAACRDRRHIAAPVFHLHTLRIRMVCGALVRRPPWSARRDLVGDACDPTAVTRRRHGLRRVPGLWRTSAAAHPDDDVVSLLPVPRLRPYLVGGAAWCPARGERLAMHCRRCGAALLEVHETLPYVGPGEYVVELRDAVAALFGLPREPLAGASAPRVGCAHPSPLEGAAPSHPTARIPGRSLARRRVGN
jgi:hypothetical protein